MHGRPAHRHPARSHEMRADVVLENSESLANVVERNAANNNDGVATVYSVVYVTASATFSGPTAGYVTVGLPTSSSAAAAKSSSRDDDDETTTKGSAKTASAASSKVTSTASTKTTATVSPSGSGSAASSKSSSATAASTSSAASSSVASSSVASSSVASSSVVLSSSSTSSINSAALAEATTSSKASVSATAAASSSGLSSGAKGGVAFAVLLLIGFVAGLTFFCMRRKKEKRTGAQRLEDLENEKRAPTPVPAPVYVVPAAAPPPAPVPEPAPSIRSNSPAPRLTIRPTSRFSLGADPEKTAAGIAAAGASIEANKAKQSPWEARSQSSNPNTDPANPFGIHAETVKNSPKLNTSASIASFELQGSPVPFNPRLSNVPTGAAAIAEPKSATSEKAPSNFSRPSGDMMSPTRAEFGTAAAVPVVATTNGAATADATAQPLGNNVHRVQLEFMPTRDDELELKPGSLVRLLHEYDDGWALCMTMDRTKQGVAPRTCMSKLPLKPRPTGPPNGRPMSPMRAPAAGQQGTRKVSAPVPRPNPHNSLVPAPLSPAMNGRVVPAGQPRQRTASGPQHNTAAAASDPTADSRQRSASVGSGNVPSKPASPNGKSPLNPLALSAVPTRKPVPGQAM